MWSFAWRNPVNSRRIFTGQPWRAFKQARGNEEILITGDYVTAFSVFQSVTRSTTGTTRVATPRSNGSLAVIDVLVSATKVNSATVSLTFDDGIDSEVLFTASTNNQPIPFGSWPVKGRCQGWKDARLDLVTVNSTIVFITVVYMHLPEGLVFADWDALR